jgi:cold shock CspA family protein
LKITGKVKWYDFQKGIGFATAHLYGIETSNILLHCKQLKDGENTRLLEGDLIEFEVNEKLNAKNILLLK